MTARSRKKTTYLFLAFLLLGGVVNIIATGNNAFKDTLLFCLQYLIYSGLLIFWIVTVVRRLLPSRTRNYIVTSAFFMLFFFVLRTIRFRILIDLDLYRYGWYLYYMPMLMIATFFLMACLRLGSGTSKRQFNEKLLLIPSGLLILSILTNDLHHLAFDPHPGVAAFYGEPGTYSHGVLFYAVYAWIILMVFLGILYLFLLSRRLGNWKKILMPLLFLLLMPILVKVQELLQFAGIPQLYGFSEIVIFCLLGIFESLIRSKLIPYNENYEDFFKNLSVRAVVTDQDLVPAFETAAPVTASSDQLRLSLQSSVMLDKDTRLSGARIHAGYVFSLQDESRIRELNEELRNANEILSMENELAERSRELDLERTGIEERSNLYVNAAKAVYPTQLKISELLRRTVPEDPGFRKNVAHILIYESFVKRKANFVMLGAERDTVTCSELSAAIRESLFYLCYLGIETTLDAKAVRDFPWSEALGIYEAFCSILECLLDRTAEIWVRLSDHELIMMADTDQDIDLAQIDLSGLPEGGSELKRNIRKTCEDGQFTVRIRTGGGAE